MARRPSASVSSVFTPPELMPNWLGVIAAWNPVSATATAIRELFGNPAAVGNAWTEANALAAAIILIFLPPAVRRFRSLGR